MPFFIGNTLRRQESAAIVFDPLQVRSPGAAEKRDLQKGKGCGYLTPRKTEEGGR